MRECFANSGVSGTDVEPKTLRQSMADMAWWFGWNASQIDALTVTEFIDWQEQITRQVKAGYSKI